MVGGRICSTVVVSPGHSNAALSVHKPDVLRHTRIPGLAADTTIATQTWPLLVEDPILCTICPIVLLERGRIASKPQMNTSRDHIVAIRPVAIIITPVASLETNGVRVPCLQILRVERTVSPDWRRAIGSDIGDDTFSKGVGGVDVEQMPYLLVPNCVFDSRKRRTVKSLVATGIDRTYHTPLILGVHQCVLDCTSSVLVESIYALIGGRICSSNSNATAIPCTEFRIVRVVDLASNTCLDVNIWVIGSSGVCRSSSIGCRWRGRLVALLSTQSHTAAYTNRNGNDKQEQNQPEPPFLPNRSLLLNFFVVMLRLIGPYLRTIVRVLMVDVSGYWCCIVRWHF